eukprot:TRINITY_DN47168_c0_g1_i1.p1 TRINITY_DN47168_c0_g1~~TRINITY_DN47168_c0_g1_i1.p1  ORF type:complete len:408 (+),score=34.60 TRINITY_DN47168_c0_g1_i1:21-1244(+)
MPTVSPCNFRGAAETDKWIADILVTHHFTSEKLNTWLLHEIFEFLRSSVSVWSWGEDRCGELGQGFTDEVLDCPPTPIATFDNPEVMGIPTAVEAGAHSVLLCSDGTVWSWGHGGCGQLGHGCCEDVSTPKLVNKLPKVTAIALGHGGGYTLALSEGGLVYSWGNNYSGQLGNGLSRQIVDTPTEIPKVWDTAFQSLVAGGLHAFALDKEAQLWSWGENSDGQLGLGDNAHRLQPTLVDFFVTKNQQVTDFTAGAMHSLALTDDATVWSWGLNDSGQLGCSSATKLSSNLPSPVVLTEWPPVVAVKATGFATLFVCKDGTLLGCGALGPAAVGITKLEGPCLGVFGRSLSAVTCISEGVLWRWEEGSTTAVKQESLQANVQRVSVGEGFAVAICAEPQCEVGFLVRS